MNSYIDLSQLKVCDFVLMAQFSQAPFNLALSESLMGSSAVPRDEEESEPGP